MIVEYDVKMHPQYALAEKFISDCIDKGFAVQTNMFGKDNVEIFKNIRRGSEQEFDAAIAQARELLSVLPVKPKADTRMLGTDGKDRIHGIKVGSISVKYPSVKKNTLLEILEVICEKNPQMPYYECRNDLESAFSNQRVRRIKK